MSRINFKTIYLIQTALFISMIYHGVWNLTAQGGSWWEQHLSFLSIELRYLTGSMEILIGLLIFNHRLKKIACIFGAIVMFIAVLIQIPNGYSYKYNGFEVALNYFLMFIYVLLNRESFLNEKS